MAMLPFVLGLTLAAQPAPATAGASATADSWWECYSVLPPAAGGTRASGRVTRSFTLDGRDRGGTYELWDPDHRVTWRLIDTTAGVRPRVAHLSFAIPTTLSRNGGAIHAYLFADGAPIASTTILDERYARRGYTVSRVSFDAMRGTDIGVPLAAADRWSLVVRHADGTEILRRDLAVADRRTRDEAFARHWAALQDAWQLRDPHLLITTPADTLPRDRAFCLLSTPDARQEQMESSIIAQ